jgi:hypothetical protein
MSPSSHKSELQGAPDIQKQTGPTAPQSRPSSNFEQMILPNKAN